MYDDQDDEVVQQTVEALERANINFVAIDFDVRNISIIFAV
jgi:hypothetical protein